MKNTSSSRKAVASATKKAAPAAATKKSISTTTTTTAKKPASAAPRIVAKPILQRAAEPTVRRERSTPRALGLSAAQLRELEGRLQDLARELKGALEGKAGVFNANTVTESFMKGDDAEVAEKQRVSNAALQELDFLKTRLALVNRALAKIEAGVYGMCEDTEEPIGYERLTVVPWARFAVHVQELHERKMRDYKVSRLRSEA